MRSMSPTAGEAANNSVARNVRNLPDITAKSVAKSGSEWFPNACDDILGKDAGAQLHYITGFPARTCYRYASGESECSDEFLHRLFHHPNGEPFWAAFMHGCTAPWWLDIQRKIKRGEKVKERDAALAAVSERFDVEIENLE